MSISGIRGADCIQCPQLKKTKKHIQQKQAHKENKEDIVEDVSSKDHITPFKHLERTCHNIVTTHSSR